MVLRVAFFVMAAPVGVVRAFVGGASATVAFGRPTVAAPLPGGVFAVLSAIVGAPTGAFEVASLMVGAPLGAGGAPAVFSGAVGAG